MFFIELLVTDRPVVFRIEQKTVIFVTNISYIFLIFSILQLVQKIVQGSQNASACGAEL
jgi:hypothetical protein